MKGVFRETMEEEVWGRVEDESGLDEKMKHQVLGYMKRGLGEIGGR